MSTYLDYSGRDDVLSGGARMIPVRTPIGTHRVWVKRVGNNPGLKVLLLHGGPGSTHEYLEACDSYLPAAGVEYYYYDQLGSGFSDNPGDPSLWELDRFVDEVEQVRTALGLDSGNFVLFGQSWGGMLATEYALHHQQHLRGLVISNMMASVPAYNAYAEQVLMPQMDQAALAEIKSLEAKGDIEIDVPALVIGARYDTMDPAHMEMMAGRLPRGRYLHCPNGSHLAMYDDQETYFTGLVDFLHHIAGSAPGS
jgi:proline iminopeptidase